MYRSWRFLFCRRPVGARPDSKSLECAFQGCGVRAGDEGEDLGERADGGGSGCFIRPSPVAPGEVDEDGDVARPHPSLLPACAARCLGEPGQPGERRTEEQAQIVVFVRRQPLPVLAQGVDEGVDRVDLRLHRLAHGDADGVADFCLRRRERAFAGRLPGPGRAVPARLHPAAVDLLRELDGVDGVVSPPAGPVVGRRPTTGPEVVPAGRARGGAGGRVRDGGGCPPAAGQVVLLCPALEFVGPLAGWVAKSRGAAAGALAVQLRPAWR
jgi:hypothetical protein